MKPTLDVQKGYELIITEQTKEVLHKAIIIF